LIQHRGIMLVRFLFAGFSFLIEIKYDGEIFEILFKLMVYRGPAF